MRDDRIEHLRKQGLSQKEALEVIKENDRRDRLANNRLTLNGPVNDKPTIPRPRRHPASLPGQLHLFS